MTMKHYKGSDGLVYAYAADGSQDHVIPNTHIPITEDDVAEIIEAQSQDLFNSQDYYRKRLYSYPEIGEFLDAWVKGDNDAMEAYRQKCLEVKAKYPKPTGF